MYTECRNYLIEKLTSVGIKRPIHINQKTLDNDEEPHKAAVIADTDELIRSSQKTTYEDERGKHKRTKKFDRTITYIVTIGDHTAEKCEQTFNRFLASLDTGISVEGNYTEITLGEANWYDEEDKIIKSKAAVVLKVMFAGGVYVDTDIKRIAINLSGAEMERK